MTDIKVTVDSAAKSKADEIVSSLKSYMANKAKTDEIRRQNAVKSQKFGLETLINDTEYKSALSKGSKVFSSLLKGESEE